MKILLILLPLFILSCTGKKAVNTSDDVGGMDELQAYMTGAWANGEQAANDSSFSQIHMHIVPIWVTQDTFNTRWLYMEQYVAHLQENPYRQRIYKIEALRNDQYASYIYKLKNPKEFVGAYAEPLKFGDYDQSIVEKMEGCEIILRRQEDGRYTGSTRDRSCEYKFKGSDYVTTEMIVAKDYIKTLERGFDNEGKQILGSSNEPYIFKRMD